METYRTQCIPFRQDESEFYLFKASAKDLLDISVVTHYNSDENDGYQRPPDRTHFRKIAVYLKDHMPAILPTAILAAISPVQVETTPSGELLLHNQIRIVDGQHRILGLRALQTGYNEAGSARYQQLLETYEFPIILMAEDHMGDVEYSRMEVEAFININSKGKRVKTDLAESLKAEMFQKNVRDSSEYVQLDTTAELNVCNNIVRGLAKDPKSFWHDRIILGDEIDRKKPISISAFSKAIRPTVSLCLNSLQQDGRISTAVLEKEEALIAGYIDRAWHAVCRKWPKCFSQDGVTYNESYNICKGIGVVPIYALFHECVSNCEANLENGLSKFINTISASNVSTSDWLVGGSFTGMSSGQAAKKIVQYLKNEIGVSI